MEAVTPVLNARMDVLRAELAEWDAVQAALAERASTIDQLTGAVTALINQRIALEGRLAAKEAALEDALAVQAAQLKQIDVLRDQLATCQKPPQPEPERAAFAVDPAFAVDRLSDEQRTGRDRLIATFGAGLAYPDADASFAGTGSAAADYAYALGYDESVSVLAFALDRTGDPALLDEITRRMALIDHARLTTANPLKESYVARLFALYALLLQVNGHADAGKWRDLTLARLNAGGGLWGNDALAQCCINTMLITWCLWLITGDASYQSYAEAARAKFLVQFMCGDYVWWHTLGGAQSHYGVQHIQYARYDVAALVLLARLGFEVVPLDRLIERVNGLHRDDGTIAEKWDGSGVFAKGDAFWVISFYPMFSAFNERIQVVSVAAWERTPNHTLMPFVPAALLGNLGAGNV